MARRKSSRVSFSHASGRSRRSSSIRQTNADASLWFTTGFSNKLKVLYFRPRVIGPMPSIRFETSKPHRSKRDLNSPDSGDCEAPVLNVRLGRATPRARRQRGVAVGDRDYSTVRWER